MVNLTYEGKKPAEEIVNISLRYKGGTKAEPPLLMYGDNFAGLSLLMNKFRGAVDLVYIDPPFNSGQDFYINNERAYAISRANEGVGAYSDKFSSLEQYMEFLRERLILIKELLSEKGSIYLHIDCKVGHYVKILMDEVFGVNNFKNHISRVKCSPKNFLRRAYGNQQDMILFYAKNSDKNIWNDIKAKPENPTDMFPKTDIGGRRYNTVSLHAPGVSKGVTGMPWRGINPPAGRHWRTDPANFEEWDVQGRIEWSSTGNPRLKQYEDEYKGSRIQDIWTFKDTKKPVYPTEKNHDMLRQIISQSSTEDSIILDCFAGSGSALLCAHEMGRKWIGIDSSEAAIDVISKRLNGFDYVNIAEIC